MANPLMSVLGVSSNTNSKSVVEQFKDFRSSLKGDPQAKINEMLSIGQITQSQLQLSNQVQTANLINQLRPFPTPAYITCTPYQTANVGCEVSGFNTFGCNAQCTIDRLYQTHILWGRVTQESTSIVFDNKTIQTDCTVTANEPTNTVSLRRAGVYLVQFNAIISNTTSSSEFIGINMERDGIAIPEAHTGATPSYTDDLVAMSFNTLIRVRLQFILLMLQYQRWSNRGVFIYINYMRQLQKRLMILYVMV